ncbi:MAG TPA: cbb3-type cytochrome c oxidase subunit I [Acidimicrobiales bacterium]|jgi:heme/copper-type cytochrome/quinol oxidase subunit 1|nr:cbb3-type cytochrome c oxidase subunit I [Acidimicrobiales bacterium]
MSATDTSEAHEVEAPAAEEVPVSEPWSPGTDHKVVGTLFVVVGLLFLVAAGVLALVLRAQMAGPDAGVVGRTTYRELYTLHGVLGVFCFLGPVWVGLATAMVPLQIGATRLAFPRLQSLALWLVVVGGAMIVAAPFMNGADVISGWALSTPVPDGASFSGHGPDLLILGLAIVCIALVAASVNLMVTVLKMRAPGLTLRRAPLFSWSVLVSSSILLLALPVLVGALVMLFVDRHYGGHIFNGFTGSGGGDPLLWPRLFWFAAYPTLWALLLPGLGVASEIVPVAARRRMFSHQRATLAIGAVGILAFAGWGSQLHSLTRARFIFGVGAIVVLLPVASLLLNWLATLAIAMRQHTAGPKNLKTAPMVYAGGFIALLGLGMVGWAAAVVSGNAGRSNYWQAASQHTLFFGAATLAVVAALAYWAPKLWGRHLSDKASLPTSVLLSGGMVVTFGAFFVLAYQGLAMHASSFSDTDLTPANLVAGIGSAITGLGLLAFVADLCVNVIAGRGRQADPDPWTGHTLEWSTSSPPPSYNFDRLPEIRSEAPMLDLRSASDSLTGPGGVPIAATVARASG